MNHVYLNGRLVRAESARVSIFDRGFTYGDGVFETLKAVDGRPLFLKEHLERLLSGLKALGFKRAATRPLETDIRGGAIERLLKKNRLTKGDSYLRITVTRGPSTTGIAVPKKIEPTFVMVARSIDTASIERRQRRGTTAVLIHGPLPALPGVKTLNFIPNILGRIEARGRRATEGVFIAPDNTVSEGTTSNVFMVSGGNILTPPASTSTGSPALPGITRRHVIDIARSLGLDVKEAPVDASVLLGADEAFLTNTIVGVEPLVRIDSNPVGSGRPGAVTRRIQRAYNEAERR